MNSTLVYIYDPMCSWCWGYAPTWHKLQKSLAQHVDIIYRLGGLAPDSNEPMPIEMQTLLQQTWRNIAEQLGTEFNFDFWQQCQPRRSTYPACRAAIVARASGKEQAMLSAIQQAYYLQAQNPSDITTLQALAVEIGLDGDDFLEQINSQHTDALLKKDIAEMRQLPIQGFPSLVLIKDNIPIAIPVDYKNWRNSYELIISKI
ncbi:DsbA family protein [Colwellia sp. 6M3]|jgi:putative protein-disulfide isomerase|uniref:DsbA family protein n=1 Tax=Colwellia sp. 6M3 TaxID=2759849 RepID=UPI0015F5962F|nr:DsbA family protein [Colwellia sp. 6M3]MBA6416808.1 DsbA family protein [Colwellia sp. 6M3]